MSEKVKPLWNSISCTFHPMRKELAVFFCCRFDVLFSEKKMSFTGFISIDWFFFFFRSHYSSLNAPQSTPRTTSVSNFYFRWTSFIVLKWTTYRLSDIKTSQCSGNGENPVSFLRNRKRFLCLCIREITLQIEWIKWIDSQTKILSTRKICFHFLCKLKIIETSNLNIRHLF